MPVYYKASEVAKMLKVNPCTVFTWINEGKLRAIRLAGGQTIRIPEDALKEFLGETEIRKENEV